MILTRKRVTMLVQTTPCRLDVKPDFIEIALFRTCNPFYTHTCTFNPSKVMKVARGGLIQLAILLFDHINNTTIVILLLNHKLVRVVLFKKLKRYVFEFMKRGRILHFLMIRTSKINNCFKQFACTNEGLVCDLEQVIDDL